MLATANQHLAQILLYNNDSPSNSKLIYYPATAIVWSDIYVKVVYCIFMAELRIKGMLKFISCENC